ncbi:DUF4352 domain-containing protein [Nocardia sp. NPDC060249]|uniref:DUF4352 domain-containing protein n=1 Tax=Nocardia sp. NPDC060249 TaxID=3347082 RepID=UPI00364D5734
MTGPTPHQGQQYPPPPGYQPRPHPSRPNPPKRNQTVTTLAIIFAGLAICGILAVVAIAGNKSSSDGTSDTIAETYANPPTGNSGDLEFQILRVTTGQREPGFDTAGGQFVSVTVKVTNIGKSAASFDPEDPYLIDAQDRRYSADGSRRSIELNPGRSVTSDIAYAVPVGITPTMFSASAGWGVPFVRISLPPQG